MSIEIMADTPEQLAEITKSVFRLPPQRTDIKKLAETINREQQKAMSYRGLHVGISNPDPPELIRDTSEEETTSNQNQAEDFDSVAIETIYAEAAKLIVDSMRLTHLPDERAELANALSGLSSFLGSSCGYL